MTCKITILQPPEITNWFQGQIFFYEIEPQNSGQILSKLMSKAKNYCIKYIYENILHQNKISEPSYNHHHLIDQPETLVSVSHTKHLGVIVIAKNQDYQSIGIDIEIESRDINPKASKFFLNQNEDASKLLELWIKKNQPSRHVLQFIQNIKFLKIFLFKKTNFL